MRDTEVRGGEVRVFDEGERDLVKLGGGGGAMMFWPVSVVFGGFEGGSSMAMDARNGVSDTDADPDAEEMDYEPTSPATTTTHPTSNSHTILLLLDPTHLEEQSSSSSLIISATSDGEIIQMTKPGTRAGSGPGTGLHGEDAIDAVTLLRCTEVAVKKVKEVHEVIRVALEKEKERRGEGKGVERELRSENLR